MAKVVGQQQNNDAIALDLNEDWSPLLGLLLYDKYEGIPELLYEAAFEGSWRKAIKNLGDDLQTRKKRAVMAITRSGATILHVAAGARRKSFVKKILDLIQPNYAELRRQDFNGNNAFCIAAGAGAVDIAKLMLEKDRHLPGYRGKDFRTPLHIAVVNGQQKMAALLFDRTTPTLTIDDLNGLFFASIASGLYDIALKSLMMAENGPNLAMTRCGEGEMSETALHMLVRKPNPLSADALKLVKYLWNKIKSRPYEIIDKLITRPTNLLVEAIEQDHFELVATVVRSRPDLIRRLLTDLNKVFQAAIVHRKIKSLSKIISLSYETGFLEGPLAYYRDDDNNNMLHLAAIYPYLPPPDSVPSPVLEMQQEFILFEEIMERIVSPSQSYEKNKDGFTPKELFIMSHKALKERGEKWMKSTSKYCMLVAAIIATVVFAAAFTVPGGYNQQTGEPIHLQKAIFRIFAVTDAIALSSSTTSIVVFLSILTSHFAIEDFRTSLPLKLFFGLLTLFLSIITMTIAFSSSFFLFYSYGERVNGITVPIAIMASVPVAIYAVLQFSILMTNFYSVYVFKSLFKLKSSVFLKVYLSIPSS